VVSVRDPIARILRTPSISRTLQIPPPTREARTKNPVATHRGAHHPDALTTIEAPTTLMRPGPSRCPKVSPRSQHRFGFRSPPRLELATSGSRPLPPDALSVRPALVFQVPIRSLSHGCSAVWRGWISRSPCAPFRVPPPYLPFGPCPCHRMYVEPPHSFLPARFYVATPTTPFLQLRGAVPGITCPLPLFVHPWTRSRSRFRSRYICRVVVTPSHHRISAFSVTLSSQFRLAFSPLRSRTLSRFIYESRRPRPLSSVSVSVSSRPRRDPPSDFTVSSP